MIVWGGDSGGFVSAYENTGGRYNPVWDVWRPLTLTDAPKERYDHTAVWAESLGKMIVFGGISATGLPYPDHIQFNDSGGLYDPQSDTWTPTSTAGAPEGRIQHTAVWAGEAGRMLVWGGVNSVSYFDTGGGYDPLADVWTPMSTEGAPEARRWHTAVWTGETMVVWGGSPEVSIAVNTGGNYDPTTKAWVNTSTDNAPPGRVFHSSLWIGKEMIVWGGIDAISNLQTGGVYTPLPQQARIEASDFNFDYWVDGLDLSQLGHVFGCASGDACFDASTDINRDGAVDGQDLAILLSVFGRNFCPPTSHGGMGGVGDGNLGKRRNLRRPLQPGYGCLASDKSSPGSNGPLEPYSYHYAATDFGAYDDHMGRTRRQLHKHRTHLLYTRVPLNPSLSF